MLSNGTRQLLRLRLRVASEVLLAKIVSRFIGRFLLCKRQGLSLYHHEGVEATVAPTRSQVPPTHVKALPLPGRQSTMTFSALRVAAQGRCHRRKVLALLEQYRLGLFHLNAVLATGLMDLGRGGRITVMRIQRHFGRF